MGAEGLAVAWPLIGRTCCHPDPPANLPGCTATPQLQGHRRPAEVGHVRDSAGSGSPSCGRHLVQSQQACVSGHMGTQLLDVINSSCKGISLHSSYAGAAGWHRKLTLSKQWQSGSPCNPQGRMAGRLWRAPSAHRCQSLLERSCLLLVRPPKASPLLCWHCLLQPCPCQTSAALPGVAALLLQCCCRITWLQELLACTPLLNASVAAALLFYLHKSCMHSPAVEARQAIAVPEGRAGKPSASCIRSSAPVCYNCG